MAEDFVTICAVCAKGITKQDLKYVNSHSFHNQCFEKQGKEFPEIDPTLQSNTSRAKIELIQLKNLKHRIIGDSKTKKTVKKSSKRKTARKSTSKRTKKTAARKKPTRKTARKSTSKKTRSRR